MVKIEILTFVVNIKLPRKNNFGAGGLDFLRAD